jgi:membrane protein
MQSRSRYRRNRRSAATTGGILQRFLQENMLQTSAALAFTTLLALVPLVAVVLAVADLIPYFDLLLGRLTGILRETLLPSGAAGTIAGSIGRFSTRAQQLTVAGLVLLVITAFLLMQTIERAFNHLWQVEPRPFVSRLRLYAFVMIVWPFLLGAVALASSFALSASLGLLNDLPWARSMLPHAVSSFLLGLFLPFSTTRCPMPG